MYFTIFRFSLFPSGLEFIRMLPEEFIINLDTLQLMLPLDFHRPDIHIVDFRFTHRKYATLKLLRAMSYVFHIFFSQLGSLLTFTANCANTICTNSSGMLKKTASFGAKQHFHALIFRTRLHQQSQTSHNTAPAFPCR